MEAARELTLSRHFAAFLGVERTPGARCDEYRLELLGGPTLAAVLRAHGPLPEAALPPRPQPENPSPNPNPVAP